MNRGDVHLALDRDGMNLVVDHKFNRMEFGFDDATESVVGF